YRSEPARDEPVESEAVERELEQCDVADAVREACAGHLCGALEVDPAVDLRQCEVIASREVERRRLADAANLDRIVLGQPVGRRLVGWIRDTVEQLLAPRLRRRQPLLEPLQLLLDALELREL